jgi:phage gp36-like protein
MSNYCQISDIQLVVPAQDLIDLTDDENTGQMNQTIITQYISDASEEIDDYLRGRYDLPFANPPGLLLRLCRDISVYKLYGRRIRLNPPEAIKDAANRSYKFLDRIQKGDIVLGVADAPPDTPDTGAIRFGRARKTFTSKKLSDYSRNDESENPFGVYEGD